MDVDEKSEVSAEQVKKVIDDFLQQRLQPKLDKLKDGEDEKRQKLVDEHLPENWLPNAARRVGQIQQVTHALKYVHPEAKGSNLSSFGNAEAGDAFVATHTISHKALPDVVGNAAALDVYKFLRLEVGGKTLLQLCTVNNPDVQDVFSENAELASSWMKSFATLTESKGSTSSHTLAKQIYWPVENGDYHLLAPLFPTSLVHQVWCTMREDRFSEATKEAREARKKELPHPHGYREYPNLAIQKFGGTKPQNISQLNSERYGENHLLPSLPPQWNSDPLKPPLKVESVFDGLFGRRRRVRELVKTLREFLYSVQDVNSNIRIRNKRIELMGYLVDEVLLFAAELRELDALWTLHPDCILNIDEQCWLNPERAKTDPEFSAKYTWADWQKNVCKRFASWLNAQLSKPKKPLPFDDDSASQWRADMESELNMLRMEVAYYD